MSSLLDNLSAIIIAGVIGLIMLTLRIRAQDLQVDAIAAYMVKTQTFDTSEWLHTDLRNIGSGRGPSQARMETPTYDAAGRTTRFAFWRRPAEDSTSAAVRYVYELRTTTTAALAGSNVQLYQVVRCQRDTGGCTSSDKGGSSERITDFRVELLTASGTAADVSNAALVRVRLSTAIPTVEERSRAYLRESHWGTTLPLMQR